MSTKKIGFVIQHINALGGTERAACAVMDALAPTMDIHLIEVRSRGPAPFPLATSITTHGLFDRHVSLLNSSPRLVHRLACEIRALKIDTLIVVEATHALYAVPAARLAGCRCIVWEHFNIGTDVGRRKRRWGRRVAARFAEDIVVLTARDAARWHSDLAPHAALHIIPNAAPAITSRPYDITSRRVMALGRLTDQKGFERLLAAWACVERDPRGAGWSLEIHGDGPMRDHLIELSRQLSRVAIHPATIDAAGQLETAGLLAASSRYEGLPMVLLEAMAHSVPCVAFDCETGPAEILGAEEGGILVPEGNVPALAESLLALMNDPARREVLSQGARKRARMFGAQTVSEMWHRLLIDERNVCAQEIRC